MAEAGGVDLWGQLRLQFDLRGAAGRRERDDEADRGSDVGGSEQRAGPHHDAQASLGAHTLQVPAHRRPIGDVDDVHQANKSRRTRLRAESQRAEPGQGPASRQAA